MNTSVGAPSGPITVPPRLLPGRRRCGAGRGQRAGTQPGRCTWWKRTCGGGCGGAVLEVCLCFITIHSTITHTAIRCISHPRTLSLVDTGRYDAQRTQSVKVYYLQVVGSRDSLVYCVFATFPLCTYIWTNHSFNASRQEPRPPRYTASWRRGREAGRIVGRTEAHFPAVMALTAPPMYCAS